MKDKRRITWKFSLNFIKDFLVRNIDFNHFFLRDLFVNRYEEDWISREREREIENLKSISYRENKENSRDISIEVVSISFFILALSFNNWFSSNNQVNILNQINLLSNTSSSSKHAYSIHQYNSLCSHCYNWYNSIIKCINR
jgi:hypothetical protein